MPNWCNNRVVISHEDSEKMNALVLAINEGKFCSHVIPVPESLQIVAGSVGDPDEQKKLEEDTARNIAVHGYGNWYDFCVSRWGTKWEVDAYEGSVAINEHGAVEFGFDSAWSPPIGVYEELVEQGFLVEATYYEPGMGYVGRWDNGVDDCFEYHGETSETVRELIGEALDDEYGISEGMAEWEEENAEE
jgi:hypothetical protein